jgi:probable rRNA maturation factor
VFAGCICVISDIGREQTAAKNMTTINFFYLDVKPSLAQRAALKAFIETLFTSEKKKLSSLTYIFCTDEYLLGINKQYLKHNFYTDIITFGLSKADQPIAGEIYISIDRVKENAISLGLSFKEELHRVIFHGALHLCGYRDKKPAEEKLMRKKENEYLKRYF